MDSLKSFDCAFKASKNDHVVIRNQLWLTVRNSLCLYWWYASSL